VWGLLRFAQQLYTSITVGQHHVIELYLHNLYTIGKHHDQINIQSLTWVLRACNYNTYVGFWKLREKKTCIWIHKSISTWDHRSCTIDITPSTLYDWWQT